MSDQWGGRTGDVDELDPRPERDDQLGYGARLHQRMLDDYQGDPIGRETLTVTDPLVKLAALPAYARSAFCTVTDAAIRITLDGTPPTSAVGSAFAVGEHFILTGRNTLLGFRAIRESGTDATLDVEYFD